MGKDGQHTDRIPCAPATEADRHQSEFDRFVAGWQAAYGAAGGTVFCRRGCSGCCSLAVNCTFPEVPAIHAALSTEQRDRLERHMEVIVPMARGAASLPEWLRSHRAAAVACPFLEPDGACGIYALRPISCRALLATRSPDWCTTDFSRLTGAEKRAFMAGLDRSIVDFPMHYVAATKGQGEEHERALLRAMAAELGFAIYGHLPALVRLEGYGLGRAAADGRDAVLRLLAERGYDSAFLVSVLE